MKKKVQCILLDTQKEAVKGNILLNTPNNQLFIMKERTHHSNFDTLSVDGSSFYEWDKVMLPKYLYFVSDDKIDGPCWCINKNKDTLYYITDANLPSWFEINKDWNKVVATTNPDLWVTKQTKFITTTKGGIPKIGDDFISAYIKSYNEGKPITEVNVEYELLDNRYNGKDWIPYEQIKLHSDGTVIISSVKDDLNPNNLKIGEEYWIKYLPCDSMWKHVKITRFTEQGYAWGEGSKHSGIISQDLYEIKPFTPFIFNAEKTYTHEQLSAISFTSFIVGIANPQLSGTELVEFHKEWFDRNYPQ